MDCRICENKENNKLVKVKEMMFGFRDEFDYLECSACGCIQILKIPTNLLKYYPENYYSFNNVDESQYINQSLKIRMKKRLVNYYIGQYNIIGKLLSYLFKNPLPGISGKLINHHSKILDIGCGTGEILLIMKGLGFTNLTGVDPFIKADINYQGGLSILKKEIEEIQDTFDFIMLHHSFEHMDFPLKKLQTIYNLLNPKSYALIRIPVASSFAWRKYQANWVQLDAPRHFYLHTIKSIRVLAEKVGFILKDIQFDSTEFQFKGSEMYLRNIPLHSENNIFDKNTLKSFSDHAKKLNTIKDGDQACFYLYKE